MNGWSLRYSGIDPEDEGRREALCTLGNGVFATRGSAPEHVADDVHYPGTYAAGVYNRLTDQVDDTSTATGFGVQPPGHLTSGTSGTASQKALINSLMAPSLGVPVDRMSDVASILFAPSLAGTEVSVR